MSPTHRSFAICRRCLLEHQDRVVTPMEIRVMTTSAFMSLPTDPQRNYGQSSHVIATTTIAILAFLLIVVAGTIHFGSSASQKERELKASVVETLNYHRAVSQYDYSNEPGVPFDRGVPDFTVR